MIAAAVLSACGGGADLSGEATDRSVVADTTTTITGTATTPASVDVQETSEAEPSEPAPAVPPVRELPEPRWQPIDLPANGASVYLQAVPNDSGFLLEATSVSESRTRADDRLYRWTGDQWDPLTIPLLPRSFRADTFHGRRGIVTGWIEPEAGPDGDYSAQAAVDVTLDQIEWERRLIEPRPASPDDQYLKRSIWADHAVTFGDLFIVTTTETDRFDRAAYVRDHDLGDYLDWQLKNGVVRMWATNDNPDGPHRGRLPAVEIPVADMDLTSDEIEALDPLSELAASPRLRLFWSRDGERFVDAEAPHTAADFNRLLLMDDRVVVASADRSGGSRLLTSTDGQNYETAPALPTSLDVESIRSDGRRLWATSWEGERRLLVSNEQVSAWTDIGPLDDDVDLRGAGGAGLVAVGYESESVSLLLSPDGVNWITLRSEELFGSPGTMRPVVGDQHILVLFEPIDDSHNVRAVIVEPDW